jgi:hypothetical protein
MMPAPLLNVRRESASDCGSGAVVRDVLGLQQLGRVLPANAPIAIAAWRQAGPRPGPLHVVARMAHPQATDTTSNQPQSAGE